MTSISRRAFVQSLFAGASALAVSAAEIGPAQAATVLKIGTVSPAGSSSRLALEDLAKRIKSETGGEVVVKVISGATVGAPDDVGLVRALRLGKIDGAELSEEGLAQLDPALCALALPRLFSSNTQLDYVRGKLLPTLEGMVDAKGFVLAGLGHAGDRLLAATTPTASLEALRARKLFVPELDTLLAQIATAASLPTVPGSPSLLVSMVASGHVDAAFLTPRGIATSSTKNAFKSVGDFSYGAGWQSLVLSKAVFGGLSPATRALVLQATRQMAANLTAKLRQEGPALLAKMVSEGATRTVWPQAELAKLETIAQSVRSNLTAKAYSALFLAEITDAIAQAPA